MGPGGNCVLPSAGVNICLVKCGLSFRMLSCELPVLSCMADAQITSFMNNTPITQELYVKNKLPRSRVRQHEILPVTNDADLLLHHLAGPMFFGSDPAGSIWQKWHQNEANAKNKLL
jgi:hypothetical protein